MYKILIIACFLPNILFSQGKNIILKRDTLLAFELTQVVVDSSKSKLNHKKIGAILNYDFSGQYPYYTTDKVDWKQNDQFTIKLNQLPDSGYVYVFSVDGKNTPRFHFSAKLDSLKRPTNLPDTTKAFTLTQNGEDHFCIWLTKIPINQAQKLIQGIEMTKGTFMERSAKQLGDRLIRPDYHWNFLDKEFIAVLKDNSKLPPNGVLPIIIKFGVGIEMTKSKNRRK